MFSPFISLSLTVFIGILTRLVVKQYRRVEERDRLRRRVQKHESSSSSGISIVDPLDHSLYWYPVAFSHEITSESKRPFGCLLLNKPLCLYRTKTDDVVCVLDICPHRSAPLSLGQMTKDGNLECIYHGWQFGINGQCVYIPSVSKNSNVSSLVCARRVPVHEQYGFIWVWPGDSRQAHSDLIPHNIFVDLQRLNGPFLLSPEYSCSLEIPYDLMVDNLLDLAHIDFTHDGTIGKRINASCIRSERLFNSPFLSTNQESFSYKVTRHEYQKRIPPIESSVFNFIPPCFIRLEHHFRDSQRLFIQVFIILPTGNNKMKLLTQFYRNFACYKWIEYIPTYDFWTDRMNKKVVDQDLLLLDGIHRNIEQIGAKPLGKTVSADGPIKAFRQFHQRTLNKFRTIYIENSISIKSNEKHSETSQDQTNLVDIEDLDLQ